MLASIDILLSTYNGEKYVSEQIESLLNQTCTSWKLIIRDDVSTDETVALIKKYIKLYPDKIILLDNKGIKKGIIGSFNELLHFSDAPYVAFCDQDDIWYADKLQKQIDKIREIETKVTERHPVLIHTDLCVVDNNARVINHSLWSYQKLCPNIMNSLERLLVQNFVTGCTMMINRALVVQSLPMPDKIIMHDWWIALVAVSKGSIYSMNISTVKYRQHQNNDTGAKKWGIRAISTGLFSGYEFNRSRLLKTSTQAEVFGQSIALSAENRAIVQCYLNMYKMNWVHKRMQMIKMGFLKCGFLRNVAMLIHL